MFLSSKRGLGCRYYLIHTTIMKVIMKYVIFYRHYFMKHTKKCTIYIVRYIIVFWNDPYCKTRFCPYRPGLLIRKWPFAFGRLSVTSMPNRTTWYFKSSGAKPVQSLGRQERDRCGGRDQMNSACAHFFSVLTKGFKKFGGNNCFHIIASDTNWDCKIRWNHFLILIDAKKNVVSRCRYTPGQDPWNLE